MNENDVEIDLDGYLDPMGVRYLGKALKTPEGKWVCLAEVGGYLCRVEVRLTPVRSIDDLLREAVQHSVEPR